MKFADTSWWVAWMLPDENRHRDAVSMVRALGTTEQTLTTNHIMGEVWILLRRRVGHHAAVSFLDRIDELRAGDRLVVHRVTGEQEDAAWQWLRRHDERAYSFVDATSFRVMRDRRIREAFAFDHDFAAAGFVEVTATH